MHTLQRLLADNVLEALQAREHVIVAPGGSDALLDEVEGIIAPAMPLLRSHLAPSQEVMGEVTSTFGHEAADDAVEAIVEEIAEQLMESDHVDDIFAEDRLIRRDSFRAIRDVLLRYANGELEVEEGEPEDDTCTISLDDLGYVVSTISQRAEAGLLEEALGRAASAAGARLLGCDGTERQACFDLGADTADKRLAVEEAITEAIVDLVDADLVELPTMEQILQLAEGSTTQPGFAEALTAAARDAQRETGCGAACTVIDEHTVLVTLTPLSEEDARNAEVHFAYLVECLECSLAALSKDADPQPEDAPAPDSPPPPAPPSDAEEPPPPTSRRKGRASKRASASKKPPSRRPTKQPASARGGTKKTSGKKRASPKSTASKRGRSPGGGKKPSAEGGAELTSQKGPGRRRAKQLAPGSASSARSRGRGSASAPSPGVASTVARPGKSKAKKGPRSTAKRPRS